MEEEVEKEDVQKENVEIEEENEIEFLSIWNTFPDTYKDESDSTFYPNQKEVVNKILEDKDFKLISLNKRKLPQVDYHYEFLYTQDITFKYKDKTYIITANIEFQPGISGKWFRYMKSFHPFLIEIKENSKTKIKDTIVEKVEKLNKCEGDKEWDLPCGCYFHDVCTSCNSVKMDDGYFINIDLSVNDYGRYDDSLCYHRNPKELEIEGKYIEKIDLKEKFDKWKSDYTYKKQLPEDKFDKICFALLIHKDGIIESGK